MISGYLYKKEITDATHRAVMVEKKSFLLELGLYAILKETSQHSLRYFRQRSDRCVGRERSAHLVLFQRVA